MAELFNQPQNTSVASPATFVQPQVLDDDTGETAQPAGGSYRADTRARVLGTVPRKYATGAFRYDVTAGQGALMSYSATQNYIMALSVASEMLHNLHVRWGLQTQSPQLLATMDDAFFFCHTLNGSSVLQPDRAQFGIPGKTQMFLFYDAVSPMGVDSRRFFRAYADFTAGVNSRVISTAQANPDDEAAQERLSQLMAVAQRRNMHRFPHLAHDSADGCMNLTMAERAAVEQAKDAAVSTTPNSVDGLKTRRAIVSADGFDSTTGTNYQPVA